MTLKQFSDTKKYLLLDTKGVQRLQLSDYQHIYDEYDYDEEWQDTVEGVYIYDNLYYIFKHKDGIYSTIVGRENFIMENLTIIEKKLYEYCEYANDEYKELNY